ncbi:AAA family ATPase [Plantibacter sp. VKM Ac-2885]|uniref:AAA family ATPase n=1 Tax=Plantibacter sp. VKM Ac-2885 TaxID=2783828 RepID=UPI00188B36FB|nr:AAA family ATPase [Plantibacter sp. VKM Ac-2885]MBF4514050.1 AAA family ATPase [Plantibacter sp. VKM Ac-2885]
MGKINLIAGQNNAGKSNVLRVVAETYSQTARASSPWDRPLSDSEHYFAREEFHSIEDILTWGTLGQLSISTLNSIREFLEAIAIESSEGTGVWVGITDTGAIDDQALQRMAEQHGSSLLARNLSAALVANVSGGGRFADALRVLQVIFSKMPLSPEAFTIGGVRSISSASDDAPDLNGLSIKRRLLELQNPAMDRLGDKKLFAKVQEFVRAVLDDESITIDVPHDLSTIHVTQDGRTLPIEHMGTGVHEVVIIAAASTITRNSILCVEEPEVHLHPILQRKLLKYLASSTSNQYFIATHSAHMLDSEIGNIFHVTRSESVSVVRYAGAAKDRAAICADLGYRPSDLVQTNAVIWVEGPSDRLYVRHWIEALAPGEFVEGTHYSIMFYGGALLKSLSPLDAEEVDEFISLRSLNRFMVVIIDSDKTSPQSEINESKQRVVADLQSDSSTGLAWVTAGYTIENYVPQDVLDGAVKSAHPSRASEAFAEQGQWDNPLASVRLGLKQPSKVAIAKRVISSPVAEWPLDLKARVEEVIGLIRVANEHL